MKKMIIKSYAKINICLDIKNKTENGYHELDMVMVPLELHDSILLSELPNAHDNFVTVDDFSLGAIDYNLATFAIDKMASKYKFNNKFRVLIHKVIPIQAGLGGGSSNAAATMTGVNKYLKLGIPDEDLMDLAKPLGADIPFFIKNKPSRCRGIGEILEPIEIKNNYFVLIVKPSTGCSTREVYKVADEMNLITGNVDDVVDALKNGDDEKLANSIFNVLEEPAITFAPEIKQIKEYLKSKGLRIVLMSGSGSSVFALSTDKKLLKTIARELENQYQVEVTKILK